MSSTAKFEKLIELIINEDTQRAEQLFHDIVVEKSREIYESIMDEDMTSGLTDEVSAEESGMDGMMEDDEFIDDEEIDGDFDVDGPDMDDMGDDEMEVDVDVDDMADDEEDADIEDRVVDLEDKLDELMAEFEEMMGDKGDDMSDAEFDDDAEDAGEDLTKDLEDDHDSEEVMENVELKKIPGLYDSKISQDYTDGSKKGPVDANSGQKGMASKPVNFDQGGTETASGTKAPSVSNYGTKGEGEVKDASKWNNRAGANPAIAKSGKGDSAGMQYGDSKSRAQGKLAGASGESVKQDNKSVIESRRTTKRRI